MAESTQSIDAVQLRLQQRFQRMGLSVRPMADGRSLLVALPLSDRPFERVGDDPLEIGRVVFSTVGGELIKCLRPRALFGLPLLDIRRCPDPAAIEVSIRLAWRNRTRELRETEAQLAQIGLDAAPVAGGSALSFPVSGESPTAHVMMHRSGEAILPSAGPLAGLTLTERSDRVLDVSQSMNSATDLEVALGMRIEELRRNADTRDDLERTATAERSTEESMTRKIRKPVSRPTINPKILLVGNQLVEHAALRQELKRQGYRAATSRSETEALLRLAGGTPDVVLAQYALGRSDGATLVQAMRALPGIERIPVLLFDDSHHESRREAARAVGAAGYIVEPLAADRFVTRLGVLLTEPGDRRFTRYAHPLSARIEGFRDACLATEVGRGGVFIRTDEYIEPQTSMVCELMLPEFGRALRFRGEVLYRDNAQGAERQGIGIRFCDFASEDESSLIEYLALIESRR